MADSTTTPARRITRQQAIVLGVLGAGLLGALLMEPSSDNNQTSTSLSTEVSTRPRRNTDANKTATWKPNWPKVSLDQMLHQNPFAAIDLPTEEPATTDPEPVIAADPVVTPPVVTNSESKDSAIAAKRQELEDAFAAFTNQKVKLTLRSGEKVSALIGNRLVHEGDVIEGVRIVSILPTGVLVEPATVEPQ